MCIYFEVWEEQKLFLIKKGRKTKQINSNYLYFIVIDEKNLWTPAILC